MNAQKKFEKIIKKNDSLVCLGLDPDLQKFPSHLQQSEDAIFEFNKSMIDATHDLVATYKPNIAFYEAYGIEGLKQLKKTIEYIKKSYPEIPVLLDMKRGDIGNTASKYAIAAFEYWDADAITVYPYLGYDAVKPFLEYKDRLVILLIKTSNPDSSMFQDMEAGGEPFYMAMAKKISKWPEDNISIFVGATYPEELKKMRKLFPNKFFLSAGFGAQSGQIEKAVRAGVDKNGGGIVFNASRSILYASSGKDFAQGAREEAGKLRDEINKYR
ncbi:MAG: orotidine-5'-phosphate decarboxylase [Candidatus Roizmanbacteria bacterium]|nr:MAG: orotidine-5'-phosphate decarboxylase [Candidatus Roizmanbacteria bacterium]